MQVESDQLKDRLLKLSSLIQSNCEFLTVVRKCITDQQILQRDGIPTFQSYQSDKKYRINEESLIQLFIQIAYLIFSCRRYNIKPEIGTQDIRVQEITLRSINQKKFSPVIFYKLTEQTQLQPYQSIAIIRQIYVFLFAQYFDYLQALKSQLTTSDTSFKSYIQKFKQQAQFLLTDTSLYQPGKQRQFFLCLQQTSLFSQWCPLLRIKNSSILDQIKTNQNNFNKFRQCKQIDVGLIIAHGNQKKKAKTDHNQVRERERDIQANITHLFTFLSKGQLMGDGNARMDKELADRVKISYKHREKGIHYFYQAVRNIVPGFPQVVEEEATKRQENPEMQYLIQYSSERNSICVRLIPNIVNVHIENADFLMYQSNILTFETVNVNIQLVQTVVQGPNFQKKTVKKLAFKGTSCLNTKEPPLQKILLLMDATMIASKICQPQLNAARVSFSSLSDHQRLTSVSNKINHYTRIYLKCAKKVYSE